LSFLAIRVPSALMEGVEVKLRSIPVELVIGVKVTCASTG
jgi:hypothetical protein